MHTSKLSALVTGRPKEVHSPIPLPGETPLQAIIRNHPREWNNCLERLSKDYGLSEKSLTALRRGDTVEGLPPTVCEELTNFMTLRAPVHGRTLEGLSSIREISDSLFFEFKEIFWLRATHPTTGAIDKQGKELAAKYGVSIIPVSEHQVFDLATFLEPVASDYLWVLPGGSRLSSMAPFFLRALLTKFEEEPRLAFFYDGGYCEVYRVKALRQLAAKGVSLNDTKETAKRLHSEGHQCVVSNRSAHPLAEIESMYGGMHDSLTDSKVVESLRASAKKKPWWKRIFTQE